MKNHDEHCLICGTALVYGSTAVTSTCQCCGVAAQTLIHCPEGHYVCDSCHGAGSLQRLASLARRVEGESPEAILEEFLTLPGLPMHGPEHHPMAALALLLAAARAGTALPENAIDEAIRRGMQIPGGSCGYLGGCGAGIALGIAVSLLTGATPLKGPERGLANRAAAIGLNCAGDGSPRCCKRALRRTVRQGRHFLEAELGITLPSPPPPVSCSDSRRNRECPGEDCPFFPPGETT